MYHIIFASISGHLGHSYLLAVVHNAVMSVVCKYLYQF